MPKQETLRATLFVTLTLAAATLPGTAFGLDRPLCTEVLPEACSDNVLEIQLDAGTGPTDELTGMMAGQSFTGTLLFDVRASGVQGWSIALFSDDTQITTVSASDLGAIPEVQNASFGITAPAVGNGFAQVVVIAFTEIRYAPLMLAQPLATIQYQMATTPSPTGAGFLIEFRDGSLRTCATCPPVANILTSNGESTVSRKVITARVL